MMPARMCAGCLPRHRLREPRRLGSNDACPLLAPCSRIYGAQIRGGIPTSFASMRRLHTLALPQNGIKAPLPLP